MSLTYVALFFGSITVSIADCDLLVTKTGKKPGFFTIPS